MPLRRQWVLLVAVFLLFSVIGPYVDLTMVGGRLPYLAVAFVALICGLNAAAWIIVLTRLSRLFLILLIAQQCSEAVVNNLIVHWMTNKFQLQAPSTHDGIRFAATVTLSAVMLSYTFFIIYIRLQGAETFRIQNELALAHGIQETLVPPITLRAFRFELYGISCPSDKVGGDLVDALTLSNGDTVAYLADIAGHGLQAGILMGMLKTAARTALLDAGERSPDRTLPMLLDRLNTVLPEVKEPQMYATFTGFRLGADGSVFYALAASPPFLHWHAARQQTSQPGEPQLPVGLLPVAAFDGATLDTAPGDLLIVATDGILEAENRSGEDYGIESLKQVVAANSSDPLPQLADKILGSARAFGRQFDDQTILIVRCL